jgi:hypothetical protein
MALAFLKAGPPTESVAPAGLAYLNSPEGTMWTTGHGLFSGFAFDPGCGVRGPGNAAHRVVRADFDVVNGLLVAVNNAGLLRKDH